MSLRQSAASATTNSTSTTVGTGTLPSTPQSGSTLIVAVVVSESLGADPTTITTPAGYTAGPTVNISTIARLAVFYKTAGVSEPTSLTITFSQATQAAAFYGELSGRLAASQIDAAVTATNSATSVTAISVTGAAAPTLASEDGLAIIATQGVPTISGASSGWTAAAHAGATGNAGQNNVQIAPYERDNLSTGAAPSFSATMSNTRAFLAAIISIKPSVGGVTSVSGSVSFGARVRGTVTSSQATPSVTPLTPPRTPNRAPGRLRFVLCKPTGEPISEISEATAEQVAQKLDGIHTATITLKTTDELAAWLIPNTQSRLKVYREPSVDELEANPDAESTLIFYGDRPAESGDGEAGRITATYQDPRWRLGFRQPQGAGSAIGVEQGEIMWSLVDQQNQRASGDTWIREGSTATGVPRDYAYERRSILDLFSELTQLLDGPDHDVTPIDGWAADASRVMAYLNVYAQEGQDRPLAGFFYGEGLDTNVESYRLAFEPVVTRVEVTGTDPNGAPISSIWPPDDRQGVTSDFGLLEQVSSYPDQATQALLDAKARGDVLRGQELRPVISIDGLTPEAPRAFEHYALGDTVRVHIRDGAIELTDRVSRIHEITIDVDENGWQVTRLTIEDTGIGSPESIGEFATPLPANLVPSISSPASDQVTDTSARVSALVNPESQVTTVVVEHGPTSALGSTTETQTLVPAAVFQTVRFVLTGLTSNADHFWRMVPTNGTGANTDLPVQSLHTEPPAGGTDPIVSVATVDQITDTTARVNGTVNPRGFAGGYHVEVADDAGFTTNLITTPVPDTPYSAGSADIAIAVTVTSLAAEHDLWARIVATKTTGPVTVEGGAVQFRTQNPTPSPAPVVGDAVVDQVTDTSIRVSADIDTRRVAGTDLFVQIADDAGFTVNRYRVPTTTQTFPAAPQTFTHRQTVTGLTASTAYNARVVAKNANGTTRGRGAGFTTESPAGGTDPIVSAATIPTSSLTASRAHITGTVNPRGFAGGYHVEVADDAGFTVNLRRVPATDTAYASGTTDIPIDVTVSGLAATHDYYGRIVATKSGGPVVPGEGTAFRTRSGGPPPTGMYVVVDTGGVLKDLSGNIVEGHGFNQANVTGDMQDQFASQIANAGEVADLARAAGCVIDRMWTTYKVLDSAKPTRQADGTLRHAFETGSARAKFDTMIANFALWKTRGVRCIFMPYKSLAGTFNSGSSGMPSWLWPSGATENQALDSYFSNTWIGNYAQTLGLGNIPNDAVKYGSRAGRPWGPLDILIDMHCVIAQRCLDEGLDNVVGFELLNEPPVPDDGSSGYHAAIENYGERLRAVNPDLLVVYPTNLLPRQFGGSKPPIYTRTNQPTGPWNGRGGWALTGHSYWHDASAGATWQATRSEADRVARVLKEWLAIAQAAPHGGHWFWNGENGYVEQNRNNISSCVFRDAGQDAGGAATGVNLDGGPSADVIWNSKFQGNAVDGGFAGWVKANHGKIGICGWHFTPGQGWSHLHTDGSDGSDVHIGADPQWKNQIKVAANLTPRVRPTPDQLFHDLFV